MNNILKLPSWMNWTRKNQQGASEKKSYAGGSMFASSCPDAGSLVFG